MKTFSRRSARKVIKVLIALGLIFIMLRWFEHSQVYHPSRSFQATGLELGSPREDVYFTTEDGVKLNAWFYPGPAQTASPPRVILLCHGNAGNISHRLDHCSAFLGLGLAVFSFDYRGYGHSEGRPSEAGTYADAQAAYRWLRNKGFGPAQILVFGESLGGGVAAELARREPVGGLILASTFTSIADVGSELFPWLPVRWLNRIKYNTRAKLPHIRVPILILHSRVDTLMPFHHARENFAAANQPKMMGELAGDHNDTFFVGRVEFVKGMKAFLETLP